MRQSHRCCYLGYPAYWIKIATQRLIYLFIMDYEQKAKTVADCLVRYKRDASGWKVCKKSVNVRCYYGHWSWLLRNRRIGFYLFVFFTCMLFSVLMIDRGTILCFIVNASLGQLCQLSWKDRVNIIFCFFFLPSEQLLTLYTRSFYVLLLIM